MSRYRIAVVTLVAASLVVLATPSHAYRLIQSNSTGRIPSGGGTPVPCGDNGGFTHWLIRSIPWRLNTANQGSGKTSAVLAAMNAWTNVTGANYVLSYAGTTTAGWSTDGINSIVWADGNGCIGGCLAVTALVLEPDQVVVETDISFNNSQNWQGGSNDAQAVATHELGHSLGIHHSDVISTPRPTMAASYYFDMLGARTLATDDISALQCSENRY